MMSALVLLTTTLASLSLSQALTCQDAPLNTYPYCNYSLPLDIRVDDLFNRLTIDEKINLTNSDQGGIPRLGIPTLGHTECTHGTFVNTDFSKYPTTLFPQAITMAQSFDPLMLGPIARAISNEVRGKYNDAKSYGQPNDNYYGLVCWAPVVNICRDPRWGRCQEGYGEDPFLQSQMAKQYIPHLQYDTDDTNIEYIEAISTCKHFDAHSGPENIPSSRMSFDSIVNYRDWIDTFQPAFKACNEVGVSSYMCSYNEINGIPSCGNRELLTDLLRNEWGFKGYVVSDCNAIKNIYDQQNAVRNFEEASQMAIKAGCDWAGICGYPHNQLPYLHYSVRNGTIPTTYIDQAVRRVLPFWFKLGLMDPDSMNPWRNLTLKTLWPTHRNLAMTASMQSMVLLSNPNNILPIQLHNNTQYKKWAILGPCINNTICYTGDYNAHPPAIITPLLSLFQQDSIGIDNINYFSICSDGPECAYLNDSDISHMTSIINNSDIIVYIGGISVDQESEGHDRAYIELPSNQSYLFKQLVNSVQKSNKNQPIITVLTYGAPVIDKYMFNTSSAIIGAGYPGQEFGPALVNILNGTYSPSGRLSVTWYNGTNQLPNMTNYDMRYNPGRTYRYLTQYPIYSFGYGLSYVEFEYSNINLSVKKFGIRYGVKELDEMYGVKERKEGVDLSITACDTVVVSFDMKNLGNNETGYNNDVDQVSQVYLRVLNNTVVTDNIRLVNFTKSYGVSVNEVRSIELEIDPKRMTVTKDYDYSQIIETGMYQVIIVGSLTLDMGGEYSNELQATFEVVGANTPISKCE